ncbi:MAG TPA: hypothetical protein VFM18_10285 [Methanosarcina sp.]|nr:hypothetical protein [Methanosarcina sp.]
MNVKRIEMMMDLMFEISDMKTVNYDQVISSEWPKGFRWLQEKLHKASYLLRPRHFSLASWRCGTVACAIGHAASRRNFQKEGFCWEKDGFTSNFPKYSGEYGWSAVAKFFDISPAQASALFGMYSYPKNSTPIDVYVRLCEFRSIVIERDRKAFAENILSTNWD